MHMFKIYIPLYKNKLSQFLCQCLFLPPFPLLPLVDWTLPATKLRTGSASLIRNSAWRQLYALNCCQPATTFNYLLRITLPFTFIPDFDIQKPVHDRSVSISLILSEFSMQENDVRAYLSLRRLVTNYGGITPWIHSISGWSWIFNTVSA